MPKVKSNFPSVVVKVDVYGHKVEVDLTEWAEELVIDPNNISAQLERQARLYFDIAEYAACAVAGAERKKQALEIWMAEKWREVMDGGKMTVDSAKNAVREDPEFDRLSGLYIDAREDSSLLENARDAMKQRQFMLSQLAGAQRAEGT